MKTKFIYKLATFVRKRGIDFDSKNDPNVLAMKKDLESIGGSVQFTVEREPSGEWWAKSTNIDGILSGGNSNDEVVEMLKDAVFTYYGISPQHCDDRLLRSSGEPKIVRQEVMVSA